MKPRIAVHKFSSCDGCQLAFLNAGESLLELSNQVEFVHFAEAGVVNPSAEADIAFIEGSITTPEDAERIQAVRSHARYLITIGACATAGGVQALRNGRMQHADWLSEVYASPATISALDSSTPIAAHVKVDLELWGCPVTTRQVMQAARDLLFGVKPHASGDSVCLDCKRAGNVCVLVTRSEPCMGPVTRTGCGALCPSFGRACYACFGPGEQVNGASLGQRLQGLGLSASQVNGASLGQRLQGLGLSASAVQQRFLFITPAAFQERISHV